MASAHKVGKYEVGRTIGRGTFAKVKFAQNTETGESVAMKVLDRSNIIKHRMIDQIKREISIMKLVRHPNVVRLHEVMATRSKIFIVLEFLTGGELFDKISQVGKFSENIARAYFQQLIDGVSCCHSKGVYHRDLKPENLLLDSHGTLKISDFGLGALPDPDTSLLQTTCGTPNYVAPEVLNHKGYNGAIADIWSCGVILYVLLAGYLPFDELDIASLYSKIERAEFSFPSCFSNGAKSLILKILDPNPKTRIGIEEIRSNEWFMSNYVTSRHVEEETSLDDTCTIFDDHGDQQNNSQAGTFDTGPLILNAFDLIILSQGLDLNALFEREKTERKIYHTRFFSRKPANIILSSIDVTAQSMGFKTHLRNYKMRIDSISAPRFTVILEIFQVAPSFFMVEIQKIAGETTKFLKMYKTFCGRLSDIIWKDSVDKIKKRIKKPWLENS
ncbi:CBL-interacting serine/threonine-protein kinase 8 [Zostera marina]|uniref:non-specific serine/threonine protein kinase n=1 Tax=Zostera marina TaxID=29655 RepID=A0A0K9Q5R8_ZOSMR|nr:CBL-interacting serine/threonine-protein kinase 8 [Zostera marina]